MDSLASNDEQAITGADTQEDQDVTDDGAVVNRREFFHEAPEIRKALQRVACPDLEPRACREASEHISAVWAQYQEQPGLLDPFLEEMVDLLMGAIGGTVRANPTAPTKVLPNLHMLTSLLYLLTTVRGYKTVSRFFPHEAADLEPCLEAAEAEAAAARVDTWSTLYCLTLWLGMVMLTPFDLQSIDSGSAKTLSARIYELGRTGLQSTSRNRDASAWMLARYFMRPDVAAGGTLQTFLRWTKDVWSPAAGCPDAEPVPATRLAFVRCGALQAWHQTLKAAPRTVLKDQWLQVLELALSGPTGAGAADFGTSSALRKLRIKVTCRAALIALPPRLVSWRYERGARSLLVNFAQSTGSSATAAGSSGSAAPAPRAAELAEEEEDVPEQLEDAIELLLGSLSDADTVVRWAAAKGIGRITSRLSRDFGDQVLESLLERCFSFHADNRGWHGGCLALAELTRRGLLLPDRLPAVVPLVCQALHFEQVTGTHAVGQHVRDAACYVCWAFARAYAPEVLVPFVARMASGLIQVAVYDREVNCRRAAAAAVQEHVGRQGTFPNGIEVVTLADYWTLSTRRHAYLAVAPQLARFGDYRQSLIDCLVERKLLHQDVQVRLLACQALGRLAESPSPATVGHFNEVILPKLAARALEGVQVGGGAGGAAAPAAGMATVGVVQLRHGAVAGIAVLVGVLHGSVSSENQNTIRNLVPSLEKARGYRGRGGDVVRQAACELLGHVAAAVSWPFKEATGVRYLQTLDECARHTTDTIQVAAVDALKLLVCHRLRPELCAKCLDKCLSGLRKPDETIAARRGCMLSVSVLPPAVLRERSSEVLSTICREVRGADLPGGKEHEDPQMRQYAVLTLGRLCLGGAVDAKDLGEVFATLEAAMHDYAVDRRGDVGSWVREAAMEVIVALLDAQRRCAIPPVPEGSGERGGSTWLVALLLQQSAEKLDRLRERACALLQRLVGTGAQAAPFDVELAYRRICHGEQYDHLEVAHGSLAELAVEPPISAWPPAHLGALASVFSKTLCSMASTGGVQRGQEEVPASALAKPNKHEDRSIAIFGSMVQLLGLEEYQRGLLMGFVVSIGGITEHTTKAARRALLQYLQEERPDWSDDASTRAMKVCSELLQIFKQAGMRDRDAEAKRMVIPLLNTIGILLAEECFPDTLAPPVFEEAMTAVRSTCDIGRLQASVSVFVGLLRWPGGVRRKALSVLLQLLGYSFPVVRQSTAKALYIRLLQEDGDLDLTASAEATVVTASLLGEVLELLSVTPWGTDNEDVLTEALHEVYTKLGFELPTGGRSILASKVHATRKQHKPEYAALVHENHY